MKDCAIQIKKLLKNLRKEKEKEWAEIWKRYPVYLRTEEERQIVDKEQLFTVGYIKALEDIREHVSHK